MLTLQLAEASWPRPLLRPANHSGHAPPGASQQLVALSLGSLVTSSPLITEQWAALLISVLVNELQGFLLNRSVAAKWLVYIYSGST